jgi:hypothetical protein
MKGDAIFSVIVAFEGPQSQQHHDPYPGRQVGKASLTVPLACRKCGRPPRAASGNKMPAWVSSSDRQNEHAVFCRLRKGLLRFQVLLSIFLSCVVYSRA